LDDYDNIRKPFQLEYINNQHGMKTIIKIYNHI